MQPGLSYDAINSALFEGAEFQQCIDVYETIYDEDSEPGFSRRGARQGRFLSSSWKAIKRAEVFRLLEVARENGKRFDVNVHLRPTPKVPEADALSANMVDLFIATALVMQETGTDTDDILQHLIRSGAKGLEDAQKRLRTEHGFGSKSY